MTQHETYKYALEQMYGPADAEPPDFIQLHGPVSLWEMIARGGMTGVAAGTDIDHPAIWALQCHPYMMYRMIRINNSYQMGLTFEDEWIGAVCQLVDQLWGNQVLDTMSDFPEDYHFIVGSLVCEQNFAACYLDFNANRDHSKEREWHCECWHFNADPCCYCGEP